MRFFLFIFCGLATAQTSQEIVVTAPKDLSDFPQGTATDVLRPEEAPPSVYTLKELLESPSGLYTSKGLQASEEDISVRGFSSKQVRILIDGLPAGENIPDIPISMIDRVVISRGPLSTLYGSNAMGGVVNIITKSDVHRTQASLRVGSFSTMEVDGQTYQNFAKDKLSLAGYYHTNDGEYPISNPYSGGLFAQGGPSQIMRTNNFSRNGGAEISYLSGETPVPVKWNASYAYKDDGIPGLLGQSYSHVEDTKNNLRTKFELAPYRMGKLGKAEISTFADFSDDHYRDPSGERTGFAEDYERKILSGGVEFKPQFNLGEHVTMPILIDGLTENYQDSYFQANRETFSLGTRLDWGLFDDRWILSPSVAASKAAPFDVQPSAGVSSSYKLSKQVTLKTNISTGFRYPSLDEMYLSRGFFVGNSDLKPEQTLGGDIGVEYKTRSIQIDASYFLYRTHNLIEYLLVSGFQYKPYNFSEALSEGFEATVQFQPLAFLKTTHSLTLQNVLCKDEGPFYDKFVPGRPRAYGTEAIEVLFSKRVKGYTRVAFALDRFVDRSNSQELIDRYDWDIGASYTLSESLLFAFDIKNVLNRNNVDIRGFPQEGRGYYATATFAL